MSGGTREGAGRKAVSIDLNELEKLCSLQCSEEEIASWFGVSVRTIRTRRKEPEFAHVMRRGKSRGRVNIRRAQMKLLDAGNPTIAVWLGKSMLGQRDSSPIRMTMPKTRTLQDLGKAAANVMQLVARGKLTPAEGETMMNLVESQSVIITAVEQGNRLERSEEHQSAVQAPPFVVMIDKEDK
jgi:hypothetical protein